MKWITNSFLVIALAFISFSFINKPSEPSGSGGNCDVDTTRIAVIEFTVLGMDSITITDVQDKLDTTCGVSFNFACWADTVVFIEYDSLLTNKFALMHAIEDLGYKASVRSEY